MAASSPGWSRGHLRDDGEARRQLGLVLGQDVDGEMCAAFEDRQALRLAVEAEEHQRRVERHRGEGIRGEADELALVAARRDDRDSSRKPP